MFSVPEFLGLTAPYPGSGEMTSVVDIASLNKCSTYQKMVLTFLFLVSASAGTWAYKKRLIHGHKATELDMKWKDYWSDQELIINKFVQSQSAHFTQCIEIRWHLKIPLQSKI